MPTSITPRRLPRNMSGTILAVVIAAAIAWGLRSHGARLLDAARALDARWLALALVLCVAHRIVNTMGWTMVLWAMGWPLSAPAGARIWLASEACRWLPGSIWAYGSRAALATRAGIPPAVAAASLVWELLLTVLAWGLVAAVGLLCWSGPVPPALIEAGRALADRPWGATLGALAAGVIIGALGWRLVRRKWARLSSSGAGLRRLGVSRIGLVRVLLFHGGMVLANGLTFWLILRAAPGGGGCPLMVALAANSIAWLAGMFALFAPGGLVVREATFGVLLAGFLPAEAAVTVALAWRAVQVAAEVAVTLAILPGRSAQAEFGRTEPRVVTGGISA